MYWLFFSFCCKDDAIVQERCTKDKTQEKRCCRKRKIQEKHVKNKMIKNHWIFSQNLKPSYSYSCSFRDLGYFWTEIARRTCDKEALDGVLHRLFFVFAISEL